MSTTISSNMTPQQIQQSREDATRQYSQNEAAYRLAQNHRSEYTPESWAEYEKNYKDYEKNYQGFISGSLDVLKASYKEPSTPTIKTETKISGPELTRRMEQIFTSETNKEPTSHVQGEAGFTVAAKGSEEAIKAPKYSVTYTANGKTTVKAFQTRQ